MIETFPALLVFLFPLAFSPGPGNMFFAANAARFGLAATLPANLGYHLATFLVTAVVGGTSVAVLDQVPQFFVLLKLAGSAYVFWLAWKLFRARRLTPTSEARPAGFRDGVVLLILNPKAYVIITVMFAQFLPQDQVPRWGAVLGITAVFTLNNLVAFSLWTVMGDTIAQLFRTPGGAQRVNVIFALCLALVALWMLLF